jgi:hypothetical protein
MAQKDVSPEAKRAFYELKLNQAQIDDRIKTDVQTVQNLAYAITSSTISDRRRGELLDQLRQNP